MAWLAKEPWLLVCLAGLAGFMAAWLWQRRAYVPRMQVLNEELALTRRRSAEIENERRQAVARLTRTQSLAETSNAEAR